MRKQILDVEETVIKLRRDLHQHPELSLKEFETTNKIIKLLEENNIEYRRLDPTGLIVDIKGKQEGPCVLLRADLDALPIQEETGVDYASVHEGIMHACGHDTHASMLLGACLVINQLKDEFNGTVRFVFQPAEEIGVGAKLALKQGASQGVDMAMSLHIGSQIATDHFIFRDGPVAAATDKFTIEIKGKGSHGAAPETGIDALYCGAAIVTQLQTMVSREFSPHEPIVVSVGSFHAGQAFNVICETAKIEGTCRTFNRDIWNQIPEVMERIVKYTAKALRCEATVTFDRVTDPLVNDHFAYQVMQETLEKIVDDPCQIEEAPMIMGGEDFAAFGRDVPIVWVQLGSSCSYQMHTSKVNFKDETLIKGVACYVEFALHALEKLEEKNEK